MKSLRKTKGSSFFSLLIKNYVLFTIVNIIILYAICVMGVYIMSKSLDYPYSEPSSQRDILESGSYENLNVNKIAGNRGYIEILDEENKVIYRSGKIEKKVNDYTDKEVEYIPDYEQNTFSTKLKKYKDKNNKELTMLIKEKNSNYEEDKVGDIAFQILDNKLNVLYSGGEIEQRSSYTKKEIGYLTDTISKKYLISKYSFKHKDGQKRTLILKYRKVNQDKQVSVLFKGVKTSFILFIVIYAGCIGMFVILLNRKVKKPINKLNDAIISLAQGNSNEFINYKGPYEFVQICNNFNVMVSKLNEIQKEKELLESEKQKMLADISHDLKTPITTIQGYAKALSDGLISKEEEKKYLNIIYQKSNNLTELINIFYEYSKLEHADFKLDLVKKDLSEFIRAYVAEKYEYIYDIGFEIQVNIPDYQLISKFDEIQLKRVFENIVNNSIKHNKEGTTVAISLKEEEKYYKIIIADDGIGIPKDIVKNIFDAFVVGDDSRNTKQGSGLGLAISKNIIEKHNGSISLIVNDEDIFKTVFEILLPKG